MAEQNTEERLKEILEGVCDISREIIGAATVNMEGLILASVVPDGIDEEMLGVMTATVLGAGEQMSEGLMQAPLEQTFVKSELGYVILNAVGRDAVLAILAKKDIKLGLVFFELKRKVIPALNRLLGKV